MALFRSPAHVGGVKFRPINDGLTEIAATVALPAGTALTTADTLRFFQIGANTRIYELTLASDDLDSNVTPTLTLNVGFLSHNTGLTASNATAYASAATVGQAGGVVRYEPTVAAPAANYTVQIVPAANAATAPAGVAKVTLTAVIGPATVQTGLLDEPYDFNRDAPSV